MNNHKIPSRRQAKPGKPLPSKKQKQTKLKTKEKISQTPLPFFYCKTKRSPDLKLQQTPHNRTAKSPRVIQNHIMID